MGVLCMIGRGFLTVLEVLLKILGVIFKLALSALQLFLTLFGLVLRIFLAFIGGCSV